MGLSNKRVVWTTHALERANEYKIDLSELLIAWERSTLYELPVKQFGYKFSIYGMQIFKDVYYYDALTDILFTCQDKKHGGIVLTVTRKKAANG